MAGDDDSRVAAARQALRGSRAEQAREAPGLPPEYWWGRLDVAVEMLLEYIDERDAGESGR